MSRNRKQYAVVVQDRAAQMLYAHVHFLAKVSVPAARKLRDALHDAMMSLESMPFRCPEYRTLKTSDRYHQLVVGRYKIIFTIHDKDMTVNIRYIFDARQENDL